MITKYLKQCAYTPVEIERLQVSYDRIISSLGPDAPLGLKEAIAAEIMETASQMQAIDECRIIAQVKDALSL